MLRFKTPPLTSRLRRLVIPSPHRREGMMSDGVLPSCRGRSQTYPYRPYCLRIREPQAFCTVAAGQKSNAPLPFVPFVDQLTGSFPRLPRLDCDLLIRLGERRQRRRVLVAQVAVEEGKGIAAGEFGHAVRLDGAVAPPVEVVQIALRRAQIEAIAKGHVSRPGELGDIRIRARALVHVAHLRRLCRAG